MCGRECAQRGAGISGPSRKGDDLRPLVKRHHRDPLGKSGLVDGAARQVERLFEAAGGPHAERSIDSDDPEPARRSIGVR